MAGAMAGSALCGLPSASHKLDTVTLTVNNSCNLSCPHCYLQYAGPAQLISDAHLNRVLQSQFRHLCIVGKEPLANRVTACLIEAVVEAVKCLGRTSSIITNGLNLGLLSKRTLADLAWVDVSLDGSAADYRAYRGGSWTKLVRAIESAVERGLRDLRILNAISSGNAQLEAMLEASFAFSPSMVVVSPYVPTRAQGAQTVAAISPSDLFRALGRSAFASNTRLRIMLDSAYLDVLDKDRKWAAAFQAEFGDRVIVVESDPVDRGLIRVTYDGLVLSPLEAIHTEDYARVGRQLSARTLDDWFTAIRAQKEQREHA